MEDCLLGLLASATPNHAANGDCWRLDSGCGHARRNAPRAIVGYTTVGFGHACSHAPNGDGWLGLLASATPNHAPTACVNFSIYVVKAAVL